MQVSKLILAYRKHKHMWSHKFGYILNQGPINQPAISVHTVSSLPSLICVLNDSGIGNSVNCPSSWGSSRFMVVDFEVTTSSPMDSLERYNWHPSVFSILHDGSFPVTCTSADWQFTTSRADTNVSNTNEVFLQESRIMLLILPLT